MRTCQLHHSKKDADRYKAPWFTLILEKRWTNVDS